jgi:FXSXX-COOH protein
VPIADVRDVPLGDLARDADVRRMVRRVIGSMEDPSRVRVAMFNSAI